MRRLDRKIDQFEDILGVLDHCRICHLGMVDENKKPYVVPLNFGYEYRSGKLQLFIHCAKAGQKLDLIKANPSVCFETDNAGPLMGSGDACTYSQKYESVIAFGKAEILEDPASVQQALLAIMRHQTGQKDWSFDPQALSRVAVIRIQVESITGKRHW